MIVCTVVDAANEVLVAVVHDSVPRHRAAGRVCALTDYQCVDESTQSVTLRACAAVVDRGGEESRAQHTPRRRHQNCTGDDSAKVMVPMCSWFS